MALDRNDPSIHPSDTPGKQPEKSSDQQTGGVKLKEDNPGSPSQGSRLESKRYHQLSPEERKAIDEKNAELRAKPQEAKKPETNDRPADSQRRGYQLPPDNPGAPGQRSRLESKGLSPDGRARPAETDQQESSPGTTDNKPNEAEDNPPRPGSTKDNTTGTGDTTKDEPKSERDMPAAERPAQTDASTAKREPTPNVEVTDPAEPPPAHTVNGERTAPQPERDT
ncbi:hypothetical protein ACFQ07_28310, partial [Actinomadura adrarensis]